MSKSRDELLESLIEKMTGVMKGMHAGHGFPFGDFKLSRPQVMILFFIARKKEGVSVKDLAAFLNVTSGAITQFIDVLAEKNLVSREEDTQDRRIIRIGLTEKAKDHFSAFKKNYYKAVSPAFSGFSEQEIEQFLFLLDKINVASP
jgi:DNA-binding MarR family transcriptional regulator